MLYQLSLKNIIVIAVLQFQVGIHRLARGSALDATVLHQAVLTHLRIQMRTLNIECFGRSTDIPILLAQLLLDVDAFRALLKILERRSLHCSIEWMFIRAEKRIMLVLYVLHPSPVCWGKDHTLR